MKWALQTLNMALEDIERFYKAQTHMNIRHQPLKTLGAKGAS